MLWTLHRFTRVLMLNHMSCRAYDDLASGERQRDVHLEHLQTAAEAIERRYKGLKAEAYLITIAGGAPRVVSLTGGE